MSASAVLFLDKSFNPGRTFLGYAGTGRFLTGHLTPAAFFRRIPIASSYTVPHCPSFDKPPEAGSSLPSKKKALSHCKGQGR
jgi:hypothetical protein